MTKIKSLLIHDKETNMDIFYMENGELCFSAIDIACHYMSFSEWVKASNSKEYIEKWIEKNIEIIEVKEAYKLLEYLIEWEDIFID